MANRHHDRKVEKGAPKLSISHWAKAVLESAIDIASKIKVGALLVCVDSFTDYEMLRDLVKKIKLILVARTRVSCEQAREITGNVILIPNVKFTRIGQVKVALLIALSQGLLHAGDTVVCLTGLPELGYTDTIMLLSIGNEFEILITTGVDTFSNHISPEVFDTLLNLAIELSHEGREGKPVGTTFVLGDHENVMKYSRPLVMNPLQGHPEEERNILDPKFKETIKEFSALDGAFIVRNDGVVIAAGRHLNAAYLGEELPRGLGSRHASAAAITGVTDAVAITISESTGRVTIFKGGKILMDIDKPPR
jgi:DNA integrity scanning protein DisA with diadenylate cyclase activity